MIDLLPATVGPYVEYIVRGDIEAFAVKLDIRERLILGRGDMSELPFLAVGLEDNPAVSHGDDKILGEAAHMGKVDIREGRDAGPALAVPVRHQSARADDIEIARRGAVDAGEIDRARPAFRLG